MCCVVDSGAMRICRRVRPLCAWPERANYRMTRTDYPSVVRDRRRPGLLPPRFFYVHAEPALEHVLGPDHEPVVAGRVDDVDVGVVGRVLLQDPGEAPRFVDEVHHVDRPSAGYLVAGLFDKRSGLVSFLDDYVDEAPTLARPEVSARTEHVDAGVGHHLAHVGYGTRPVGQDDPDIGGHEHILSGVGAAGKRLARPPSLRIALRVSPGCAERMALRPDDSARPHVRILLVGLLVLATLGILEVSAFAAKGPRITGFKITPSHIVVGQTVTVNGTLSPSVDADQIIIQEWRDARWWTVRRAEVRARSFTATFRPKETGSGVVRGLIPGSRGKGQWIAVMTVFRQTEATWYGPGFYGNSTACGQTYTETIIGVAHRTLPCGTNVTFFFNGVVLTVPVIDRGPYSSADWDLSAEAARRLGFTGRQSLGVLIATEPGE